MRFRFRGHVVIVMLGVVATVLISAVLANFLVQRAVADRPWKSPHLVREIAAPDHVWYINVLAGDRQFIASADAARPLALQLAQTWFERLSAFFHPLAFLIQHSTELSRPALVEIPAGKTESWLKVPRGYVADIIAGDLSKPRVLGWDPKGRLVVSEHLEQGRLVAFDDDGKGNFVPKVIVDAKEEGRGHLFNAHGFVFTQGRLYVASEDRIESWEYDAEAGHVRGAPTLVTTLPLGHDIFAGGGHRTRTLVMGSDGKLYVSIGSSCDGCVTLDPQQYAVVKRVNLDGSHFEAVATGLRNTVFFVEDTVRGLWYGNDMGRDDLGEELPPDELNILHAGHVYGWPRCYGDKIPVPKLGTAALCAKTDSPAFSYPAHAAPLGLRIIPATFHPAWTGDLLVSLHGSIIRKHSVAGYSVVRVKLDAAGNPTDMEEVIGGFLRGENVPVGRPVDLLFGPDGTLYISDDHAGVIHRVRKQS